MIYIYIHTTDTTHARPSLTCRFYTDTSDEEESGDSVVDENSDASDGSDEGEYLLSVSDIDLMQPIKQSILDEYIGLETKFKREILLPRLKLMWDITRGTGMNWLVVLDYLYDESFDDTDGDIPDEFKDANQNMELRQLWIGMSLNRLYVQPKFKNCIEMLRAAKGAIPDAHLDKVVKTLRGRRPKSTITKIDEQAYKYIRQLVTLIVYLCDYADIPCCICMRANFARSTIKAFGTGISRSNPAIQFIRACMNNTTVIGIKNHLEADGASSDDPGIQFLSNLI